jgi:hypothetical protein
MMWYISEHVVYFTSHSCTDEVTTSEYGLLFENRTGQFMLEVAFGRGCKSPLPRTLLLEAGSSLFCLVR